MSERSLFHLLSELQGQLAALEARAHSLEADGRAKDDLLAELRSAKPVYTTEELPSHRGFIPVSPEIDGIVRAFPINGRDPPETDEFQPGFLPETTTLGSLFHDVMSAQEIDSVIGFCLGHSEEMVPAHTRLSYRNCDRVEVKSQPFADFLWARLLLTKHAMFTTRINDALERHVDAEGADLEGVWEAYGLNPLIRIIRYPHGGHFSPHFDGHYDFSHNDRTMLTCMMYLTDEFDGGETAFLSEPLALGREATIGPLLWTAIAGHFKPRAGSCIVFSHHLLHQGNPTRERTGLANPGSVLVGEHRFKWILRTEVCFKRVVVPTRTPSHARAMELLDQARAAESHRDYERAQELYRAAFKLHPDLNRTIK